MAEIPSQVELWSHFQTRRPEVFAQAANRHRSLVRQAERLTKGRTLLNVGCGSGSLEEVAMSRGWKVLSVDPDQRSIERLKSIGIEARCGTIESLPVASESLDAVVCSEVLEHLTPLSLANGLKEIRRVLVPGGVLVGTVPYREKLLNHEVFCPHCHHVFHRWGHQQSFDEQKLRTALSEDFAVIRVGPSYFPEWHALNWKGRLVASAKCALSLFGFYGATARLAFAASKPDERA